MAIMAPMPWPTSGIDQIKGMGQTLLDNLLNKQKQALAEKVAAQNYDVAMKEQDRLSAQFALQKQLSPLETALKQAQLQGLLIQNNPALQMQLLDKAISGPNNGANTDNQLEIAQKQIQNISPQPIATSSTPEQQASSFIPYRLAPPTESVETVMPQSGQIAQTSVPNQNVNLPSHLQEEELKPYESYSNQAPQEQVLNPGNKAYYKFDDAYTTNPSARMLMDKMGLKLVQDIKQDPASGQIFVTKRYPSGKMTVSAIRAGEQPLDIAMDKEIGKANAEIYKTATEAVQTSDNSLDVLNEIKQLTESQEFKDRIGPLNSKLAPYFGTDEGKELFGKVSMLSGQIMMNAASQLKGAFTGRDQSFIKSMKPNVNDTVGVFLGKLETMSKLAELTRERNSLIANYVRQHVPPEIAMRMARDKTSFDPIMKNYSERNIQGEDKDKSKEEFFLYYKSLSPEQRASLKAGA